MRQLGLGSKPKPAVAAGGAAGTGEADRKSAAAAALAAAKAAASVAGAARVGTVTVTEQRRFAGQTITVSLFGGSACEGRSPGLQQRHFSALRWPAWPPPLLASPWPTCLPRAKQVNKEVAKGSKEEAAAAEAAAAAARKQAGLDAVLASLQQAKKVTVLDKSRADWKDYKQADDSIEEELEMHKRSGDQVGGGEHGGGCRHARVGLLWAGGCSRCWLASRPAAAPQPCPCTDAHLPHPHPQQWLAGSIWTSRPF